MTASEHLPRVGSLELHTAYVLVRDASGAVVERVEREAHDAYETTIADACEALRSVARQRWGRDARVGPGRYAAGLGTYDVHAPVATSIESALRSACEGGVW